MQSQRKQGNEARGPLCTQWHGQRPRSHLRKWCWRVDLYRVRETEVKGKRTGGEEQRRSSVDRAKLSVGAARPAWPSNFKL